MSARADGTIRCDSCGKNLGNGGIFNAAKVSDLNPVNNFDMRQLHLCREPREGAARGCVGLILTPEALANYTEVYG